MIRASRPVDLAARQLHFRISEDGNSTDNQMSMLHHLVIMFLVNNVSRIGKLCCVFDPSEVGWWRR